MKRLQVILLVALSSTLLLFGCGKEREEVVEPIVEQVVEDEPETIEEDVEAAPEEETQEDLPPQEGMGRVLFTSSVTHSFVTRLWTMPSCGGRSS